MVTRGLADSVRVFATAIPIALILQGVVPRQWVMPTAVLVLGTLTVIYTYKGGMRAVVWTEILQATVYLVGGLSAIVLLGGLVQGGWSGILAAAGPAGKLRVLDFYPGFDRPHTVFVHDPYRIRGFQHRDHRKAGITATDAVYPFARDHLHFPEHITRDGLQPHKVRELWYWGADEPDIIVDVTESIDRQIAGLIRHESQVPGFNVPEGHTIGERVKKNAAEHAEGYGFQYGAVFRRLMARR
jgi:hypothetical protein